MFGDKEEATVFYFAFCACLKEKYGLVDRAFDDNLTKRGKEWIDIHHIREYELWLRLACIKVYLTHNQVDLQKI